MAGLTSGHSSNQPTSAIAALTASGSKPRRPRKARALASAFLNHSERS